MKKLFDEIPYLEDQRIILRRIVDSDADALEDMVRNSAVYRYEPSYLFERQYQDMHLMIRDLYGEPFLTKQNLILGIELKEDHELCGMGEYYDLRDSIHECCIGYRLREKYWRRGIASAAVKLMTNYLFTHTDIEIVTASVLTENHASAHTIEKIGFIRTASGIPEDWGWDQPTLADKWFL